MLQKKIKGKKRLICLVANYFLNQWEKKRVLYFTGNVKNIEQQPGMVVNKNHLIKKSDQISQFLV